MTDLGEPLRQILQEAKIRLRAVEGEASGRVARRIVKGIASITDMDILADAGTILPADQVNSIRKIVSRRLSGEPLSRIFGYREFFGLDFTVTSAVLDPRPDSECLINVCLEQYANNPPEDLLDLGTGSGCLAIALLSQWPFARATAVDISVDALTVARTNAASNGVEDRCIFIRSDWFAHVPKRRFDLIIANPPYIRREIIPTLDVDVRNYDPMEALDGGIDGLDAYRLILADAHLYLKELGFLVLECGFDQVDDLTQLGHFYGFSTEHVRTDYGGNPRIVALQHGGKNKFANRLILPCR